MYHGPDVGVANCRVLLGASALRRRQLVVGLVGARHRQVGGESSRAAGLRTGGIFGSGIGLDRHRGEDIYYLLLPRLVVVLEVPVGEGEA